MADHGETVQICTFLNDRGHRFPALTKRHSDQRHFMNGEYCLELPAKPRLPHRQTKRRSSTNLSNHVLDFCNSGLFVWFSSNSLVSGRGSLMVYHAEADKLNGWYASFMKQDQWKVNQVKNMKRDLIDRAFHEIFEAAAV